MDSNLLIVLTIFVGLTSLAMVAQAIAVIGMMRVVRRTQARLEGMLPQATRILSSAELAVDQTGKFIADTNVRTIDILDATKLQLNKVDDLLTDAAERAKLQMERAELVLDDAMSRTQHTVAVVQRGVLRPIREVQGVLAGVRTAIATLGRANRPTVDHATSDEEMFI